MSFFKSETHVLCPIGIIVGNQSTQLFEVRLPEQRELRADAIKRVLNYMKELRRWFALTDDRRLKIRLINFLDCLPLGAYNDLKLVDLTCMDEHIIEDNYSFFVGNTVYEKDQSNDEFCVNVAMLLMM